MGHQETSRNIKKHRKIMESLSNNLWQSTMAGESPGSSTVDFPTSKVTPEITFFFPQVRTI